MDAPLLMRGKDVEQDFGIAVGQLADDLPHRLGVYRRSPGDQAFAEGAHPMMILIQRLPARQSAPRSEERRVVTECVSTCRSRGWPYHKNKQTRSHTSRTSDFVLLHNHRSLMQVCH